METFGITEGVIQKFLNFLVKVYAPLFSILPDCSGVSKQPLAAVAFGVTLGVIAFVIALTGSAKPLYLGLLIVGFTVAVAGAGKLLLPNVSWVPILGATSLISVLLTVSTVGFGMTSSGRRPVRRILVLTVVAVTLLVFAYHLTAAGNLNIVEPFDCGT
jgi:hypothetical protein